MGRHIFKILLLLFLVFGFSLNGMAEPPEDIEKPPSKEQMEKVRRRIATLKMWRLTQAIDLDEKTSAQLFPLLNKYDKKRVEIKNAMRDDMKQLREALKEKREGNLKNILDRLEQNRKALQGINDEEKVELKKILTIEQQARFIIFQQKFHKEIRKIIAEAKQRRAERFREDRPERALPPERPSIPER
ncbi:MAG: hypothetical protein HZC12_06745 [Nitrospirae bacterium]|nr:hypothetical protein [Nitrospirota bacterium]